MSKDSSAKYYQNNKERLQKEKEKTFNMGMKDIKTFLKMKKN